jgi:hypothetical protein
MLIKTISPREAAAILAGRKVKTGEGVMPSPVRTKPAPPSLEFLFAELWAACGNGAPYVREYTFYEGRKWRFDFCFVDRLVAVECDGGQKSSFGGGRHNTDADRDKLNHAAAEGWRVLRFSRMQLEDQPEHCAALVIRALEGE